MVVRAVPMCRRPEGAGAMRTRTGALMLVLFPVGRENGAGDTLLPYESCG